MEIPVPPNEARRLEALRRYAILDTPPDAAFDRIARAAARLLRVPVAFISLVESDRQWFKSNIGLATPETPRAIAFCAYTILQDTPLVVEDATADPRFAANPLVAGPSGIRFYAGVPLKSRDGFNLGTLSVADHRSRRMSAEDLENLADLAAMAADELELRLAVIEAQQAESLRETVFAAADLGISITDHTGRFVEVNPAYCRMFGHTCEELIGQPFAVVLQSKDLRRAHRIHEAFMKRWSASAGEWEAVRKDGTTINVFLTARRFTSAEGRRYAVTTVTDLTPMKRLEQELRQAHKMEAIGRFAGGLAHEFNNLLTIVIGNCQTLLDELGWPDPLRGAAEQIADAAERAAALTRQLLAFSRHQPFSTEPVDLNTTIADARERLQKILGDRIALELNLAADLPNVRADRPQLEQVIVNLALNARDAMPQGGRLAIATATERLDADRSLSAGVRPGWYVVLTIADTGLGMSQAVRARIFEPFFTTKQPGRSAGLGLAMTYAIVKRFGGGVSVESEPHRGTTFRILFPESNDLRKGQCESAAAHPGTAARTVLIVEDEAAVRQMLVSMLTSLGYTPVDARDGYAAVEIARALPELDLLLTDVVVPGLSGPDLAAEIARQRGGIKVLYISGVVSSAPLPSPGAPGIRAGFLTKPFNRESLSAAINRLFRQEVA